MVVAPKRPYPCSLLNEDKKALYLGLNQAYFPGTQQGCDHLILCCRSLIFIESGRENCEKLLHARKCELWVNQKRANSKINLGTHSKAQSLIFRLQITALDSSALPQSSQVNSPLLSVPCAWYLQYIACLPVCWTNLPVRINRNFR